MPAAIQADVIVIGAGISGVAAARKLTEAGLKVIVLEARDRIGGRMWTDRSLGTPLDMGASWIHGIEGNPITELAKQFKVKTLPSDYDSITIYNAGGRRLSEGEVRAIRDAFDELLKALDVKRARRRQNGEPDISLHEAIQQIVTDGKLSEDKLCALNYAVNANIEHEYAADAADLSLYNWNADKDFDGIDVLFLDGYDLIIKGLAGGLDIRLEHLAQKVAYGGDGVVVATSKGLFEAKRVVVTLPLGVLKHGSVEFDPPLPPAKIEAIHKMGMNVLNRVYLRFPKVFWKDDDTDLIGYLAEANGEWAETLNVYKYTGQPILLMFNAGEYGMAIEKMLDGEIVTAAMTVLRKIYGDGIPEPEAAIITRWGMDSFTFGSYSHFAPGSGPGDCVTLAEPVAGRVYFAGEATHGDYLATVHGAHLSGLREAERIISTL